MATVHTHLGPGEIIAEDVVRGRKSYRVAGQGFDLWLDETKVGKKIEGRAPVDFDNSTALPYNPDPQFPAIPGNTESTIQPIHGIDPDERLRSVDSVTFEDRGGRSEPHRDTDIFGKSAGLYEDGYRGEDNPHGFHDYAPSGARLQPGWAEEEHDIDGDPIHSDGVDWSDLAAHPGPYDSQQWYDRHHASVTEGSVHEANPAALVAILPALARGVGSAAGGAVIDKMMDGGGEGEEAPAQKGGMGLKDRADEMLNAVRPGAGWGPLIKPSGLSGKYIDITASADYHHNPILQFRHDPDAYISRVGNVLDETDTSNDIHLAQRQYMDLVEADPQIREAAWKDVRQKGVRLRTEGKIAVHDISPSRILATVEGDNGVYDVMISREGMYGGVHDGYGLRTWRCACLWGQWAWKRKYSYVGRLCSHGYAAFLEMQSANERKRGGYPKRSRKQAGEGWDVTRMTEDDHREGRELWERNNAENPNTDQERINRYYRTRGSKTADALQMIPTRLTPELVINDTDDASYLVDVTKDERHDTGPGDILGPEGYPKEKSIEHFSSLMALCDRQGSPYPRELVGFLERYAADDDNDDKQQQRGQGTRGRNAPGVPSGPRSSTGEPLGQGVTEDRTPTVERQYARDAGGDPTGTYTNDEGRAVYPGGGLVSGSPADNAAEDGVPYSPATQNEKSDRPVGEGGGGSGGKPAWVPTKENGGIQPGAPAEGAANPGGGGGGTPGAEPGGGSNWQENNLTDAINTQKYTVGEGDTLSDIAQRSGWSENYQGLADQAGIKDPNVISTGQELDLGMPKGTEGGVDARDLSTAGGKWGAPAPQAADAATSAMDALKNTATTPPAATPLIGDAGSIAPPANTPTPETTNPATPPPAATATPPPTDTTQPGQVKTQSLQRALFVADNDFTASQWWKQAASDGSTVNVNDPEEAAEDTTETTTDGTTPDPAKPATPDPTAEEEKQPEETAQPTQPAQGPTQQPAVDPAANMLGGGGMGDMLGAGLGAGADIASGLASSFDPGMIADVAQGVGNMAAPITQGIGNAVSGIASGLGGIFGSRMTDGNGHYVEADRSEFGYPTDQNHIPFEGSGPLPPLEYTTSEDEMVPVRRQMEDVTEHTDGPSLASLRDKPRHAAVGITRAGTGPKKPPVEPELVKVWAPKVRQGAGSMIPDIPDPYSRTASSFREGGMPDDDPEPFRTASASDNFMPEPGVDIVAQFQRSAAAQAVMSNSGGQSNDDLAGAASAFLQRTAGRNFSMAEQAELMNERHPLGARNLDSLDLSGTHYEAENSVGLFT